MYEKTVCIPSSVQQLSAIGKIRCQLHLATHLPFVPSRCSYKAYSLSIGNADQLLAVNVHTNTYQGRMGQVCLVFRDQLQRSDTRHLEGQKSLQALKAEFDNLSTIVPRRSSLASSSSPHGSGNHAPGLRCCCCMASASTCTASCHICRDAASLQPLLTYLVLAHMLQSCAAALGTCCADAYSWSCDSKQLPHEE